MVLTDMQSRKARRKEERRTKKKSKRPRDNIELNTDEDASGKPTRKKVKTKEKRSGDKASHSTKSLKQGLSSSRDDLYADIHPDVAAAMRNDDAEIAELEAKLGLANEKEKKKLRREYAKLEGYGDDFGDFLDGLDSLTDRLSGKQPSNEQTGSLSDGMDQLDEGYFSSSDGEEVVPMKDYSAEDLEENGSYGNEFENEEGSENSEDEIGEATVPDDAGETKSVSEFSSDSSSTEDEETENADHHVRDTYQPTDGEDIYGNARHKSSLAAPPKKYLPPHLRKPVEKDDDANRIQALRSLERALNNVLNRLSEDTMISVAQSVAKLYPSNPTSDVNDSLWKNLQNACVARPLTMSGLIPVYVACMAGVHFQTGDQVQLGGYLMENAVTQLWTELSNARSQTRNDATAAEDDLVSKESCNLVLVLCYLYNFGIVHCTFMYSVIRKLIQHFSEIDVELLLLMLSHCGFSLRSDDPLALKEIVLKVQSRAAEADTDGAVASSSRVQYMISAMTDLKNNKKSKQDIAYGEKTAKLRKFLGRIKSTVASNGGVRTSDSSLRISLQDLLNVDAKGRWWKVGASWVGNQFQHRDDHETNTSEDDQVPLAEKNAKGAMSETDDKLLRLASKLRMNTDVRRSIFCIVMGSEDCEDAFEKLVRAGMLKNRTERDTVRVVMECCGNEKSYNPFYSHLACRICDYQPQCKFTFQLAYWDIFKQFENIKVRKAANLAKLLFHLVAVHHALKLSLLKVVDMSPDETPEPGVIFLTVFFSSMFDSFEDPGQVKELFDRGIPRHGSVPFGEQEDGNLANDGESLRESLSVFFLQTLKSSPKNKKKSKFRANFKTAVKACETDGLDSMMAM